MSLTESLSMPDPKQIIGLDGQPIHIQARAPAFDEEQIHKDEIFRRLGDLEDIEVLFNDLLVAKYIRGKVSEHLEASPLTQREDQWTGVCGLVLKKQLDGGYKPHVAVDLAPSPSPTGKLEAELLKQVYWQNRITGT